MLDSVRALLEGLIDYAGLFPPAALGMAEAAANYGRYLEGENGWMLGRFIVPVQRLPEFENELAAKPPARKWHVSAIAAPDLDAAIPAILAFNAHARDAEIDCVEARADSPSAVHTPIGDFTTYFELAPQADPAPILQAIGSAGCRAKIRTGGSNPGATPNISDVARFIRLCDEHKTPFKATAGLHHPVRAGETHGFLNVFLAAAFLWTGIAEQEMEALLGDEDLKLSLSHQGIGWARHWIATQQIRAARQRLAIGFGSCSFDEPVADLKARGLI